MGDHFRTVLALAACVLVLALAGCKKEGCLGQQAGCRVPSPCQQVTYACPAGDAALSVRTLAGTDPRPGGLKALPSNGDVLLQNGKVSAVISAIGNQNYLDPNGGALLDFSVTGANNDGIAEILQVIGVLPADEFKYTSLEIIDEHTAASPRVAVQLRGVLNGHPDIPVATLYELRPCDEGVRVRSEIVNGSADPQLFFVSDGYYWSTRSALPFTPNVGEGFQHASFGLTTINDAFRDFPFLVASLHSQHPVSYGEVSCSTKGLEGFNSSVVSAVGLPRTIVQPRDSQVFERILTVSTSDDVAASVDAALGLRAQLWKEKTVRVTGKVQLPNALALDSDREVSIQFSEGAAGSDASKQTPWSEVVPKADGTFSLTLPAGKHYLYSVHSFGRSVLDKDFQGDADTDLGTLVLPGTAQVTVHVTATEHLLEHPVNAEVFVVPADAATRDATQGSLYGQFDTCSPYLGPSPGGSPACDRFLVPNGEGGTAEGATVELPLGHYWLYAYHGPFFTLARQEINLTSPNAQTLSFHLSALDSLTPAGTVGADFHVHGAASFDSSIPDMDRVLSFDATGLQVLVATDHDVVHDYTPLIGQLGMGERMSCIVGVETTGHIPWLSVPGDPYPRVIGHYNFWPLAYQPYADRRGGPFDELLEPGALMDRIVDQGLFTSPVPIMELNHPWSASEFGRDLGFPRALGMNMLKNLPDHDDGTNAGVFVRAPNGRTANDAHMAQEVINGTNSSELLSHRAFWFYMLSQGKLRTGTANSDSHSLVDNTVGVPRNLVYAATQGGPDFDIQPFNQAIKDGRVLGTNGPIIEATLDGADGKRHAYGLALFKPDEGGKLHLRVSAAPWVPVQQIRLIFNGKLVKSFSGLTAPADPFGTDTLVRYDGDVALSDFLPSGTTDGWLVVEAGDPIPLTGDLGGERGAPDGIPDTGDNNGDGKVDAADVAPGATYGPLNETPMPTSESDPRFHYAHVLNGAAPYAFTNPFVLDRNGNGAFEAPGVEGSR